jgi:hypothetical protein
VSCTICQRFAPSKCYWYGEGVRDVGADVCTQSTCLACGIEQCHGNGSSRGTCKRCHYGILPGWSGSQGTCAYKGCGKPAAYRYLPGGKAYACKAHGDRKLEALK